MKNVFILRMKPNKIAGHIDLAFDFKPDKESVLFILNKRLKNVTNTSTKLLFEKCISGINMYGVPSVGDGGEGWMQWKDRSQSTYSSHGYTGIKRIDVITKGK